MIVLKDDESDSANAATSSATSARPLLGLVWDVGIPVVGFYTLHLMGASDWVALTAATVLAGGRVFWVALRQHRVTWFAAMMMLVFSVGLASAFVIGDPRLMLAKNSVGQAVIGGAFLASLAAKRPLTLIAFQTWRPHEADALARSYDDDPTVRRVFRRGAWMWGVGMIAEAVLRLPLIYLIPLSIAVGASAAFMVVVIASLAAWTAVVTAQLTPMVKTTTDSPATTNRDGRSCTPLEPADRVASDSTARSDR